MQTYTQLLKTIILRLFNKRSVAVLESCHGGPPLKKRGGPPPENLAFLWLIGELFKPF